MIYSMEKGPSKAGVDSIARAQSTTKGPPSEQYRSKKELPQKTDMAENEKPGIDTSILESLSRK